MTFFAWEAFSELQRELGAPRNDGLPSCPATKRCAIHSFQPVMKVISAAFQPMRLLSGHAEQMTVAPKQEAIGHRHRGGHDAFTHRILAQQFKLLSHAGREDHPVLARRVENSAGNDWRRIAEKSSVRGVVGGQMVRAPNQQGGFAFVWK